MEGKVPSRHVHLENQISYKLPIVILSLRFHYSTLASFNGYLPTLKHQKGQILVTHLKCHPGKAFFFSSQTPNFPCISQIKLKLNPVY